VTPDLVNHVKALPGVERLLLRLWRQRTDARPHADDGEPGDFVRGFSFTRGNADAPDALQADPDTPLRTSTTTPPCCSS